MEKIYVEEKNNKKSSFKALLGSKVPHHLSALMILVAFASFLAMQFSGNSSYAIMYDDVPDSFEVINANDSHYRQIKGDYTTGEGINYIVPYMATTSQYNNLQVFCLDRTKDFPTTGTSSATITYNRTSTEVDPGIVYIMSKLEDYYDTSGKQLNLYTRTWITQTAIWIYQNEQLDIENGMATLKDKIKNDKTITAYKNESGSLVPGEVETLNNLYADTIAKVVEKAKTVNKNTINVTKTGEVTVTSDNKYYKSPLITVTGFTAGGTYSLTMNNVPDGTKLYREDGTEIKDINNIDVTKFYVLVPINKVTEKTKKVTLSITGPAPIAYVYEPPLGSNYQTLTVLEKQNVSTGLDLEYTPVVPDTGLSTAQSIYFIGLVVLLCGLGIIYANTKSKVIEE